MNIYKTKKNMIRMTNTTIKLQENKVSPTPPVDELPMTPPNVNVIVSSTPPVNQKIDRKEIFTQTQIITQPMFVITCNK
jgi:hypothetical protein